MSVAILIREFHVAHKTLAKLLGMNYQLLQTNVPVFLPSSGSIADNGALTLATALDATYANCYLYFPANAISAGSAAGLYYTQMNSTTAGTIFNNTYTSGKQSIPSSPTAFVTTGPGAYTQTTAADITLLSLTLPGGALGANGSLFVFPHAAMATSGSNKVIRMKLAGVETHALGYTATLQSSLPMTVRNKGVQNRNVSNGSSGFSSNGSASPTHTTIDTSADATILLSVRLTAATDYAGFVGVMLQINPGK